MKNIILALKKGGITILFVMSVLIVLFVVALIIIGVVYNPGQAIVIVLVGLFLFFIFTILAGLALEHLIKDDVDEETEGTVITGVVTGIDDSSTTTEKQKEVN